MDNGPFKCMFDISPIGQALTTWEGRILHINRAGADLMGTKAEAIVGSIAQGFYEDAQDRISFLTELEKSGHIVQRHLNALRVDGSSIQLCVSARKVGNSVIRGVLWAFYEDAKST